MVPSHRWVYPIIYLFWYFFWWRSLAIVESIPPISFLGTFWYFFFGVEALPSLSPSHLLPFLVYFWCRFVEALLLLSLSHLLLLQRDSWEAHQPSVCPEMPRFRPEKTLGKYTDGESAKYYWRHKDTKTLFSHFGFCLWQKYFKKTSYTEIIFFKLPFTPFLIQIVHAKQNGSERL